MKTRLTVKEFKGMIKNIHKTLEENKDYLTKLDSFIGDGDHGTTICRGVKSALEKIEEVKPTTITELLKTAGFALISSMGGAAGPLFGSVFLGMAEGANGKDSIDLEGLEIMFSKALEKVSKIGKANPGDKTMIDSLAPAVESLKDSLDKVLNMDEAMANMSRAAQKGALSTKEMVAKKGKSRYQGKRALGYQDAGATTMYLIIDAMYKSISQEEDK